MAFDRIRAVLFDKDGTLFDFAASWTDWAARMLEALSQGEPARKARLAEALRFDPGGRGFAPDSPVIAGTLDETSALIAAHVSMPREEVTEYLSRASAQARMQPAVPLGPLLSLLAARPLVLGVATNADEREAHRHLQDAGIAQHFRVILGCDSGYTPKPAPDMLLAFATATGHAPAEVVMVGDSTHDLIAGRAAGMATVGVLTGMAAPEVLAPHADIVLPDIGHLPDLLGVPR
ncbi:MAG: HAD family hydrolase [Rhodobacteraceae bacterium]|nr:MAG: HAD family hydrolase [Paracoccaceae bacterium]